MEAKVLTAQSLCKRYGTLDALDHVDLTLEPGHIYGLIGRNGAGKTTLLSALTAQMPVDAGTVTYGGAPVWENEAVLGELCFSRELGSTVGGMNNALKVKDYLNAGRLFYPHWDETYAQKLITQFKLAPKKKISALSKGMASMLTIVLAQFCAVTGRDDVVNEACAGLNILHTETLGRQKSCVVRVPAETMAAKGLDVDCTSLPLQKVFVALCGHEQELQEHREG